MSDEIAEIPITLYTPHHNQETIHRSIENEPYKYYVLDIGRQFGKSLLATNQCLRWGLNKKIFGVVDIAWVSPIYNQANKVYESIVKAFAHAPFIFKKKDAQKLKIEFYNGSTIQFFSAERYDNIRGFTFDYLVIDEFAFIDEQAWTEVLRATVLVKGKKVLLISTPKGKNHFFSLFNLDGVNPQYKSFRMTSYDNPKINPQEIDDAKATLPEHVFRQEYLAEFIDGGAALFTGLIFQDSQPSENNFAGIDVGRADDYTVLTIYNDEGKMFYCERWRQMEWAAIVKNIRDALIDNKVREADIEVNSIGDAIYDMLKAELSITSVAINPFVTTSKSKQDIVEQLMVANQNKEISVVPKDWLKKEFEMFTYDYNPKTRTIKYSAPNGFHDDGVMSSAIGYNCYKRFGKQSWGYTFR